MKVTSVQMYSTQGYTRNSTIKNSLLHKEEPQDSVNFRGKGGKFLGGLIGGAAGGAAGGAIIGGGSLAGMWAMATALGPVGWGLAALYTAGGALVGGYVGSDIGDEATDRDKKE